ncbi:MAG TPA: hypothetical protein VK559_11485 [Ferruginibacter sp.]|nr:hypothetical protein [Ferruginibacter sp.]
MKTISFLIASLVSLVIFSSCGKTSASGPIIGTWKADSSIITGMPDTGSYSYIPGGTVAFTEKATYPPDRSIIEIFKQDGTAIEIDNTQTPPDTTLGNFYSSNGIFYLHQSIQTPSESDGRFKVSNNHATLTDVIDTLNETVTGILYLTRQ